MRIPLIALLALSMFVVAPTAQAAKPAGLPVATIDLSAKKNPLRTSGTRVQTTGKAVFRFKKLGFTIADVRVTGKSRGTFVLKDGFRVKKGKKSVLIRGMLVKASGRNVTITGKLGKKRTTIFTGKSKKNAAVDTARTELVISGAKLSLSKRASRAIRAKVPKFKPRTRSVGAFNGSAHVIAKGSGEPTADPEASRGCNAPDGTATTDLPKPAGAIDVSCGFFVWALRSSWLNYLPETITVPPAQPLPPVTRAEHVCVVDTLNEPKPYYYSLPVASGWWNPVDGTGELRTTGGMHFLYPERSLDITVKDLSVRFNGADSSVWLTAFHDGAPGGERIKFLTFNSGVVRFGGPLAPGTALTRIDTKFTQAAIDMLLGYYSDGEAGCFDTGFNF